MAGIFERMKDYINKIEKYDFECEAGNLRGCQEWIDLKKEIEEWEAMEAKPCENATPKNHIERMEVELQELEDKMKKLDIFLEKETEEPKFTDEIQRILLKNQKEHMKNYAYILKHRIYYDIIKKEG